MANARRRILRGRPVIRSRYERYAGIVKKKLRMIVLGEKAIENMEK